MLAVCRLYSVYYTHYTVCSVYCVECILISNYYMQCLIQQSKVFSDTPEFKTFLSQNAHTDFFRFSATTVQTRKRSYRTITLCHACAAPVTRY